MGKKKHKQKSVQSPANTQDLQSLLESLSKSAFTQANDTTKLVDILTSENYRAALVSDEKTVYQVRGFIRCAYQNNPANIEDLFTNKNSILSIAASAIDRKLKHLWCHCFIEISRAHTQYIVATMNNTQTSILSVQKKWHNYFRALQNNVTLSNTVPNSILFEGLYAYSICYQYNFGTTFYLSEDTCEKLFILLKALSAACVDNLHVVIAEGIGLDTIQFILTTLASTSYIFFLQEWKSDAFTIPTGATNSAFFGHAQCAVTILSKLSALIEIIMNHVITVTDKQKFEQDTAGSVVWHHMKQTGYYSRHIPGKPLVNMMTLRNLQNQTQKSDASTKDGFVCYLFSLKAFVNAQISVYQPFAMQHKNQNFVSILESSYATEMNQAMMLQQRAETSASAAAELIAEETLDEQQRRSRAKQHKPVANSAPFNANPDNSDTSETLAGITPPTKPQNIAKFMTPRERVEKDLASILQGRDVYSACNALFERMSVMYVPNALLADAMRLAPQHTGPVPLYLHLDRLIALRYNQSNGKTLIPWETLSSLSGENKAAMDVLAKLDFETVYEYIMYCIELTFLYARAAKNHAAAHNYSFAKAHCQDAITDAAHVALMLHCYEDSIMEKGYIAPELLSMLSELAQDLNKEYEELVERQSQRLDHLNHGLQGAMRSPKWINNPGYLYRGPSPKTQERRALMADLQQQTDFSQVNLENLLVRYCR